jgi:hypothetical protein
MTGDSIHPFRFRLARSELTGNRDDRSGVLQGATRQQELGLYVTPSNAPFVAAKQASNERWFCVWVI